MIDNMLAAMVATEPEAVIPRSYEDAVRTARALTRAAWEGADLEMLRAFNRYSR